MPSPAPCSRRRPVPQQARQVPILVVPLRQTGRTEADGRARCAAGCTRFGLSVVLLQHAFDDEGEPMPAMPEPRLTNLDAPDVLMQPGVLTIGADGAVGGRTGEYDKFLGDLVGVYADGDAFEAAVRAQGAARLVYHVDEPVSYTHLRAHETRH